jgi:hypothetical protein
MKPVGCFNIWKLIASSTLPATLLHLSDEQQVGLYNAWVLIVIHFTLRVARSLLKAAKSQKQ